MTAMSAVGSRPTTVALTVLPAMVVTVSVAPLSAAAVANAETTWLLVRM